MIVSRNQTFHKRVKDAGLECAHAAEVGVWHPDTSNVYGFILDGVRTTLVEPEPHAIDLIVQRFGGRDNVKLHTCAVCDFNGEVDLLHRESSTFVATLETSPAMVNDGYSKRAEDAFTAQAVKFSEIDDGTIDVLSVDTEGSEWFVLKHMISRPRVISLETHGGAYRNPYYPEITQWMREEGYVLWYKDASDSVYVREGTVKLSALDRIRNQLVEFRLALGVARKRLSNRWKGRR